MENLAILSFYLLCFLVLFLCVINAVLKNCLLFLLSKQKNQDLLPVQEYDSHDNWEDYTLILNHSKEYAQVLKRIKSKLKVVAFFIFFFLVHFKIRTDIWTFFLLVVVVLNLFWYFFEEKLPQKTPIENKARLTLILAKKIKYFHGFLTRSSEISSHYYSSIKSKERDITHSKQSLEDTIDKKGLEQYLVPVEQIPLLSVNSTFKEVFQKARSSNSSVLFFYENAKKEVVSSLDLTTLYTNFPDSFEEKWQKHLVYLDRISQNLGFEQLLLQISASKVQATIVTDFEGGYLGVITLTYLMDLTSLKVLTPLNIPKASLKTGALVKGSLGDDKVSKSASLEDPQLTTITDLQKTDEKFLNGELMRYSLLGDFPMGKFLSLLPSEPRAIWQDYEDLSFSDFLHTLRLTPIRQGDQFTYHEVSFEIGGLDVNGAVRWAMVSF